MQFSKVTYNDFNGNKQYEYFAKIDVNEKNVNEIRKLNKTMYKGNYGYGDSIEDIKFFNWWQLKEQSIDFELLINWYNYGATITTTIYCCKPENGKVVMYIRSGSFI